MYRYITCSLTCSLGDELVLVILVANSVICTFLTYVLLIGVLVLLNDVPIDVLIGVLINVLVVLIDTFPKSGYIYLLILLRDILVMKVLEYLWVSHAKMLVCTVISPCGAMVCDAVHFWPLSNL